MIKLSDESGLQLMQTYGTYDLAPIEDVLSRAGIDAVWHKDLSPRSRPVEVYDISVPGIGEFAREEYEGYRGKVDIKKELEEEGVPYTGYLHDHDGTKDILYVRFKFLPEGTVKELKAAFEKAGYTVQVMIIDPWYLVGLYIQKQEKEE